MPTLLLRVTPHTEVSAGSRYAGCLYWTNNNGTNICHLKSMLAPPSNDKKNQCQSGHTLGPPPPPPSPPSPVVVKVDPSTVTHTKQPGLMGCHVDLGFARQQRGIYSQLLYGESFETFAAKRQQQGGQQQQQQHGQQRHESQPEPPLTYWLPFDGHPAVPTPTARPTRRLLNHFEMITGIWP